MTMLQRLLGGGQTKDNPELLPAIERAVARVSPLLRQTSGYPGAYRKSVAAALEYARDLAAKVPGPVEISNEAYAGDALVHALFPSAHSIIEACGTSCSMRDYLRQQPSVGEMYALMGMRRVEKSTLGLELSGQNVLRDVCQNVVYFTGHSLENVAPTEAQSRQQIARGFFDKLVDKVAERVAQRKRRKQSQTDEKDMLMARLHSASAEDRSALQKKIDSKLKRIQAVTRTLDLDNYKRDFEAVLLNPEQYLRLELTPIVMDSMGIRRQSEKGEAGEVVFYDLVGFDRRIWTVSMVHCHDLQVGMLTEMLQTAHRRLEI